MQQQSLSELQSKKNERMKSAIDSFENLFIRRRRNSKACSESSERAPESHIAPRNKSCAPESQEERRSAGFNTFTLLSVVVSKMY